MASSRLIIEFSIWFLSLVLKVLQCYVESNPDLADDNGVKTTDTK